jgi:hypothetical protein
VAGEFLRALLNNVNLIDWSNLSHLDIRCKTKQNDIRFKLSDRQWGPWSTFFVKLSDCKNRVGFSTGRPSLYTTEFWYRIIVLILDYLKLICFILWCRVAKKSTSQPSSTMSLSKPQLSQPRVVATSVYDFEKYTLMYYLKGALAGGLCCGVTHGALCPVDVVKTRMQLSPEIYNKGMVDGFKKVIANEGAGALLTGLGATAVGYFIQGQLFILRVVLFPFYVCNIIS